MKIDLLSCLINILFIILFADFFSSLFLSFIMNLMELEVLEVSIGRCQWAQMVLPGADGKEMVELS